MSRGAHGMLLDQGLLKSKDLTSQNLNTRELAMGPKLLPQTWALSVLSNTFFPWSVGFPNGFYQHPPRGVYWWFLSIKKPSKSIPWVLVGFFLFFGSIGQEGTADETLRVIEFGRVRVESRQGERLLFGTRASLGAEASGRFWLMKSRV